jgi:hypothetical protein
MPIDACLERGVFEPEATTEMAEAFEAACRELQKNGAQNPRQADYCSGTRGRT